MARLQQRTGYSKGGTTSQGFRANDMSPITQPSWMSEQKIYRLKQNRFLERERERYLWIDVKQQWIVLLIKQRYIICTLGYHLYYEENEGFMLVYAQKVSGRRHKPCSSGYSRKKRNIFLYSFVLFHFFKPQAQFQKRKIYSN